MINYNSYDAADRWYKLLELFSVDSSSSSLKHEYVETRNAEQKPLN